MLISMVIVAYTSTTYFYLTTNKVKEMSMRLSEYNAQSGKNALSFHVENISDLITQLLAEASLRTFSTIRAPAPEDIRQYSPLISSSLESFPARAKNAGISIRSVNLFLKNGSVFTPNQAALPFYDYNGALDYFQSKGFSMAEGYTRTFWSLVNISGAGTLEKLGVAIFIFDNADLYNSYSAFTENGLVVNNQGIILISPNPAQVGSAYDDKTFVQKIMKLPDAGSILTQNATGSELILSYYPVMNQSGYLVVPFDFYSGTMQQEMSTYLASTLFLTVLGIVCSFLLSLFLSRGLTRTIVALSTFIKRVDNGQSKLRYHSKNKDEISMIGESVNEMLDKLKLAADLREEDLIVQQQLELSLMQLQINPHLLYNTLESVLWSLEHDKSKDAAMSIASLSEFFKISLSRGNMIIPLRDELQLIRHYVNIQRLVRHKHITLVSEVGPEIEQHPIVKLTLQPLVENAILHGFASYQDDGIITIAARHTGDKLFITVRDNGIGILPEDLENIAITLQTYPPKQDMRYFGLYNANRRLVQTYGPEYGIRLRSKVCEYTEVTVLIPYSGTLPGKDDNPNV